MNPRGLWTRLCVLATVGLIALGPLACCCVRAAALGAECGIVPQGHDAASCSACCAAGDEAPAATCRPPDENRRCEFCGRHFAPAPLPASAVRDLELPGDLAVPGVALAELAPAPEPLLPTGVRRERSPTLPVATGREWLAWACILRC